MGAIELLGMESLSLSFSKFVKGGDVRRGHNSLDVSEIHLDRLSPLSVRLAFLFYEVRLAFRKNKASLGAYDSDRHAAAYSRIQI